ncbi:MAG: HAMP domain-containing protein, partial [Phycisphaerae bacterium]|nr:HAMP domain-containing protein [Phycisphaerae bacterium]
MKIRAKRTTLLLCFALLPIMLLIALQVNSMRKMRNQIVSETHKLLVSNAEHHLQTVVNDFGRIVRRDRLAAEQSLVIMAQQIEERLAAKAPKNARPYFADDYANPETSPSDMTTAPEYRKLVGGVERDISISYSNVVFFLTTGTQRRKVIGDIDKLASMGTVCWDIKKIQAAGMTWLYCGFEKGFFMSYPGHGGYPENYDPRKRKWYEEARAENGITWSLFPDVSTRKVAITISKPVKYPDGKLAGVAGIDMGLTHILDIVNLPEAWKASAVILQVDPKGKDSEKTPITDNLLIVAQESYDAGNEDWQKPIKWEYLTSPDMQQLEAMKADILAGRPGIRRMRLKDQDTIWAYGKYKKNQPLVVVIVPYDHVVAQAASTEEFMLGEFKGLAVLVLGLLILVFVAALIAAIISARAVTKPISQLATAAGELSNGNFEAKTDIHTGDELQDLGAVFNSMGPKLLAEQEMRRSLEIAREIQQRLLPQSNPSVKDFDIAGATIYCDETGGDYYDYL